MEQIIYQVDAFSETTFGGNPAAVCPLQEWLPDDVLLNIAAENNLAETAFYIQKKDQYHIRWFTPEIEVDLCGHATLASAYVLFEIEQRQIDNIRFYSHRSGVLNVRKKGALLTLDLPTDTIKQVPIDASMKACFLNDTPKEAWKGKTDYLFIFDNQKVIENIALDFQKIEKLPVRGVIITAEGKHEDFVSRFFAPQCGIKEDPVTGSAHTSLVPYWAKKLNKNSLSAKQISKRGGVLACEYLDDSVLISGKCVLYLKGTIYL